MIRSEKKLMELKILLGEGKINNITEALLWLRDEEPFSGALSAVISIYNSTESEDVRKQISSFMNDIKEQSARQEVIEELRRNHNPSTVSMLVSSCWQSGLDYSEYSADFAGLFVSADLITSIECFTVLEESSHHMQKAEKDSILSYLCEHRASISVEKLALFEELVKIFR